MPKRYISGDGRTDIQKLSNYRVDCKGWLWNWIRIFYYWGGITMIEGVWEVKIDGSCWPEALSFSDYGGQNMVRKPKNLKISKIVILSFGPILGYFWGLGVPQIIFFKNQEISTPGETFSGLKTTKTNQIGVWRKGISAVTDRQTYKNCPIIE